jgi:hypothetical protein
LNGEDIYQEIVEFFNEILNTNNLQDFVENYISNIYRLKNIILNPLIKSSICFSFNEKPDNDNILNELR